MTHFSNFNDFSDSFHLKLLKSTIYNIKKNDIIVTNADKNIGTVLIESRIYFKLCFDHLSDKTIYLEIDDNPLDKIYNDIMSNLNYLHDNGHIISSLFILLKNTLNNNKTLANFRIMPKLHKTKLGIRPLINCSRSITSVLSKLLDFYFKPIVHNHFSYIKDSQDLILKNVDKKFEKNSQLYSADFESLYTNIPIDDSIHIISTIIAKYTYFEINAVAFNSFLKLLLKNSYFYLNHNGYKKFFLQIKGIFMGTAAGPSIANLYLSYFENLYSCIHDLPLFYRYIDDIFFINSNSAELLDFGQIYPNLKLNVTSGSSVVFLDLEISLENSGLLSFDLYVKKTNTFSYLLPISNHPSHIVKNIPKNLLIRIKKICSNYNNYLYHSNFLLYNLLSRNYNFKTIKSLIFSIGNQDRLKLLPYKTKKPLDMVNKIFFVSRYEKNIVNFPSFIHKIWDCTIKSNKLLCNTKLNVVYNLNYNLGSYLVNNLKILYNSYSYRKCDDKFCKVCSFANVSTLLDNNFNIDINVATHSSCDSTNCVYIIKCKKCKLFYIGQTKRSIKVRLSEHLSLIKSAIKLSGSENFNKKFVDCSHFQSRHIYSHFSLNHTLCDDFSFQVFASKIFTDRLRLENDLIKILKTQFPHGLNDKVSNYVNTLNSYF